MRLLRCFLLLAVALCVLTLGAAPAQAATSFYVSCVGGSNANSGTSTASPWATLSPVNARTFAAGDVVNLARGCSWDGGLVLNGNGTSTSRITLQAYGSGAKPIVRCSGCGQYGTGIDVYGDFVTVDGLLVRDARESGVRFRSGADNGIVRNSEATAVGLGFVLLGQFGRAHDDYAHDLTMVVNTSGGNDDYGAVCFWVQNHNNEVDHNVGRNCRASSLDYGFDGGFVEVYAAGNNVQVHHNLAVGTNGFFEVGGSGSVVGARVHDNVIRNVYGGFCLHMGGTFAITVDDFRVEQNTLSQANGSDKIFQCVSGVTSSRLRLVNNIFESNVGVISSANGTPYHANNLYDLGQAVGYTLDITETTGDPGFIDPAAENFGLQATSPAIDLGANLGYAVDFNGDPRPSGTGTDAGAVERQDGGGGSSPVVPGAPTSVGAAGGDAQASVSFVPPGSDGGAAIDAYRASCTPGSTFATGSGSPIDVAGLTNGVSYTCTVAAHNSVGWGLESSPSNSFTPAAAGGGGSTFSVDDAAIGTGDNQWSYVKSWTLLSSPTAYAGSLRYSKQTNAVATLRFVGTKADLYFRVGPNQGVAGVSVDGGASIDVDLYAASYSYNVLRYTSTTLPIGAHTVAVRYIADRNPLSSNLYVNVDRALVTP